MGGSELRQVSRAVTLLSRISEATACLHTWLCV